jgi:hypothetical protein
MKQKWNRRWISMTRTRPPHPRMLHRTQSWSSSASSGETLLERVVPNTKIMICLVLFCSVACTNKAGLWILANITVVKLPYPELVWIVRESWAASRNLECIKTCWMFFGQRDKAVSKNARHHRLPTCDFQKRRRDAWCHAHNNPAKGIKATNKQPHRGVLKRRPNDEREVRFQRSVLYEWEGKRHE